MEGCWARQVELEAEVEEMRLLWRSERAIRLDYGFHRGWGGLVGRTS